MVMYKFTAAKDRVKKSATQLQLGSILPFRFNNLASPRGGKNHANSPSGSQKGDKSESTSRDPINMNTTQEGPSNSHSRDGQVVKSRNIVALNPMSKIDEAPEDCVIEIKEKLDRVRPCQGCHSIFEVPRRLRKLGSDAYTPDVVSIGPYHRGKKHLREMEKHKWRLLKSVVNRSTHTFEGFVKAMLHLEEVTRKCYSKIVTSSSREFVEMMLLDACFILELLNVCSNGFKDCAFESEYDTIFSSPFIRRDLLMLENQLPFCVLGQFYAMASPRSTTAEGSVVIEIVLLALKFFDSVIPKISENLPPQVTTQTPPLHLLHIVHLSLTPSVPPTTPFQEKRFDKTLNKKKSLQEKRFDKIVMHSVTRLRGTDIRFKKKHSTKLTDIEFNSKDGVLYIPPLVIDDSTKSIFLNLMAFEQCYPYYGSHVTSYVSFMDGLINSSMDVVHLIHKRIIEHGLGSEEEVASLFNSVRKEMVFDISEYYLSDVSQSLNLHFIRKWHTWRATLKHQYLKNPWKIISIGAATLLIFLTLAQTLYTILSFHVHEHGPESSPAG